MFHPDSFLIRFLTKVCDLLFLNIVFVLSCATIVCSGAAVTSLYAVTLRMIRGQDYAPMRGFFRGLRENFLPSFPVTLLLFGDVTLPQSFAVHSTPRRCLCRQHCSFCWRL